MGDRYRSDGGYVCLCHKVSSKREFGSLSRLFGYPSPNIKLGNKPFLALLSKCGTLHEFACHPCAGAVCAQSISSTLLHGLISGSCSQTGMQSNGGDLREAPAEAGHALGLLLLLLLLLVLLLCVGHLHPRRPCWGGVAGM